MKPQYQSPLYAAEKQLDYNNHLKRIARIQKQRRRQFSLDQLTSKKPLPKKPSLQIELQNQKLLSRLMDISHRKSLTFSSIEHTISVSNPGNNPHRKKMLRQIHEENQMLAERLIAKQSEFKGMQREAREYQRIKRSMIRNKRVNLPLLKRDFEKGERE